MKICLIGDIFVDVTLKSTRHETKMRLGGIVHAARALWALGVPYSVAYLAPAYLDKQIEEYLIAFGCEGVYKIGNVIGSPYVYIINEAREIGDQGYEFLLRDEISIEYLSDTLTQLEDESFSDILLFAGNFNSSLIYGVFHNQNIHLDVTNCVQQFSDLTLVDKKFKTIFVSTSSALFLKKFSESFDEFKAEFELYCHRLILKENRGGSRGFDFLLNISCQIPSQTRPIVHSVGVGDVYNATFVAKAMELEMASAMNLSSWIAAEYASTTYPDDFYKNVGRILGSNLSDLLALGGVSIAWEDRLGINVYIAAPDFDFVDTSPIEDLVNSLKYHNFAPRRPIKENGQMESDASKGRKQELFHKDMALLGECQILIAVLLYNDPGTLIEIGIASAKGLPTLVYDPYDIAKNCMLTELPDLVTNDLDHLISEFFIISSKLVQ